MALQSGGQILASVVDENGGLVTPTVEELFDWPDFLFEGTPFAMNLVGLLYVLAAVVAFTLWMVTARRARTVPRGLQSIMEPLYEFIRNGIVVDVMGPKGLPYVPFLATMFTFILICNLFEITFPFFFPPTSNMAIPALLAILVWFIFNIQGMITQGVGGYFKSFAPPGVPGGILPLVVAIEFISVMFVRPLSLAVRLFANMVAGHTLIVMFAVFVLYNIGWPDSGGAVLERGFIGILVAIPSFAGLVAMFGFEIFVSFIQAFIFTMLTAVYIGGALEPAH